jgi:hypothetical protein
VLFGVEFALVTTVVVSTFIIRPKEWSLTMTSHWSSKIFVFKDEHGQDYVSTALPTGGVFDASQVRVYQASGPYMPIDFPKPELVRNATEWMADLKKRGFAFEPSTLA